VKLTAAPALPDHLGGPHPEIMMAVLLAGIKVDQNHG
jgi:hypothetical protein